MTRIKRKKKYLMTDTDRHGTIRWYFRCRGVKVRLPNPSQTSQFEAAYESALRKSNEGILKPRVVNPKRVPSQKFGGYVYFLKSGDYFKVGYTTNAISRATALNTSMANPIDFMMVIPGTMRDERYFHKKFAKGRTNGEWFRIGPHFYDEMQSIIEARSEQRSTRTAPPDKNGLPHYGEN